MSTESQNRIPTRRELKSAKRKATTTLRADAVALNLSENASAKPIWIQIAKQGTFRGHPAGAFEMNARTFAEIISNFNSTKNRRIAIDFEHASEQAANQGSIPDRGAPAQGWILDLEVRADGNLWGLVEWLPLARKYIRSGQYRFLSPAIVFGAKDRVTGKPIGAKLSSVALTNNPFLDGMSPVAAKDTTPRAANTNDAHAQSEEREKDIASLVSEVDRLRSELAELRTALADANERKRKWRQRARDAESRLAEHDEQEIESRVDDAIACYRLAQPRSALLALCRADRVAFSTAYPAVPHRERYLMSDLTGGRNDPQAVDISANAVRMREAALDGVPDVSTVADEILRDARAKGIESSRERAFAEAHKRVSEMRVRLRSEGL